MSNDSLFNETDARSAYDKFTAEAIALPKESIQPFRGDALLAYHNVKTGASAVLEHESTAKQLPEVKLKAIKDLPNLAMAVVFAARQVNREPEATELAVLWPRVSELRTKMLAFARGLALTGAFPQRDVAAIVAGHGKIDNATDLVQLSALYEKCADAAAHQHGVTPEEIKEAAQLGSRALTILKPATAPRTATTSSEIAAAVDMRDRMWTLLTQRYENHLWRAGAWIFKTSVDTHVPPLQSRSVRRAKDKGQTPNQPDA